MSSSNCGFSAMRGDIPLKLAQAMLAATSNPSDNMLKTYAPSSPEPPLALLPNLLLIRF
jgi:hypothetical protein